jgi:hypothetical protein
MAPTYAALLSTYRSRVRTVHDQLVDYMTTVEHLPEAGVLAALDRLYVGATGTSATLACAMAGVDHVAEALSLSHAVLVWVALRGAQGALQGPWTLTVPPPVPTPDELAALLQQVWTLEQAQRAR